MQLTENAAGRNCRLGRGQYGTLHQAERINEGETSCFRSPYLPLTSPYDQVSILGRVPGTQYYEPLDDDVDDDFFHTEEIPGVLIVRLRDSSLHFGAPHCWLVNVWVQD